MEAFTGYIVTDKKGTRFYNQESASIKFYPQGATQFRTIKTAALAFTAFIRYTKDPDEAHDYEMNFGYQMIKTVPYNFTPKFVE
jgi:hypothetical protein